MDMDVVVVVVSTRSRVSIGHPVPASGLPRSPSTALASRTAAEYLLVLHVCSPRTPLPGSLTHIHRALRSTAYSRPLAAIDVVEGGVVLTYIVNMPPREWLTSTN